MSQTSHESVMRTPYSLSPILIVLLISICAPVDAQVPTAQSGNFRTHPLVPAHGDTVGLTLGGSFAYSNALMTATDVSVVPELVTVNLTATWDEGTSAPVDGVTTSWSVDVDLGPLDEQVFDLLVRVDGEQFFFTYFVGDVYKSNHPGAGNKPGEKIFVCRYVHRRTDAVI